MSSDLTSANTVTGLTSTSLELDDIQHGVLHQRPSPYVGTYLLLRIDNRDAGRKLVQRLCPVMEFAQSSSDLARNASISVGFTYQGLRALGVPQESLASFAPEFRQGMAARAAELGDVGDSSPDHWEKPLGSPEVHVALSVLSPDAAQLEILLDRARRAHEELPGVQVIWRQDCYQLPTGRTSFGFKDGIGQPAVEGSGISGTNPEERPIKAGEFILGYPDETGSVGPMPTPRSWAATVPTWCSGNCTPGWPPTGNTSAPKRQAVKKRRCSARKWSAAGRAVRPSRCAPSETTPVSARTPTGTTTSVTEMIYADSNVPPARMRGARTPATRSITR
jgi:hypothetical protein